MQPAYWPDRSLDLLQAEMIQREDEGHLISEKDKAFIRGLEVRMDGKRLQAAVAEGWERLENAPKSPAFPYVQPDDLPSIREQRPSGPRRLNLDLDDDVFLDRLHGAWTGRAVGCALGKPVEGWPRDRIKRRLRSAGDWPLRDYFRGLSGKENDQELKAPDSWREHIAFMEPDDDIHYTLIGLKILESFGKDFEWWRVPQTWNAGLCYDKLYTAELLAMLNYNFTTPKGAEPGVGPDFTSRYRNPYREWIGAQIRADGWAYCCAGNPELAAELAWRDACWTHTANGIYGAMFFAAVIAAAFAESDPRKLVEIGLSEIPRNCRYAHAVREALEWIDSCKDWESFMCNLERKYPDMSRVHVINNALIVIMSLFYGGMDTAQTPCTAVMAGLDTDCNGATAGSVVGAVAGRQKFARHLADPLHDTIKPQVFGFQEVTMKTLAERCLAVHKKINAGA